MLITTYANGKVNGAAFLSEIRSEDGVAGFNSLPHRFPLLPAGKGV